MNSRIIFTEYRSFSAYSDVVFYETIQFHLFCSLFHLYNFRIIFHEKFLWAYQTLPAGELLLTSAM